MKTQFRPSSKNSQATPTPLIHSDYDRITYSNRPPLDPIHELRSYVHDRVLELKHNGTVIIFHPYIHNELKTLFGVNTEPILLEELNILEYTFKGKVLYFPSKNNLHPQFMGIGIVSYVSKNSIYQYIGMEAVWYDKNIYKLKEPKSSKFLTLEGANILSLVHPGATGKSGPIKFRCLLIDSGRPTIHIELLSQHNKISFTFLIMTTCPKPNKICPFFPLPSENVVGYLLHGEVTLFPVVILGESNIAKIEIPGISPNIDLRKFWNIFTIPESEMEIRYAKFNKQQGIEKIVNFFEMSENSVIKSTPTIDISTENI